MILLLLMDIPFQVLLLSPVILWFTAAPRWHPFIIAGGTLFWGSLAWLVWRKLRRAWAEQHTEAMPQGDWRWPDGCSAEQFDRQCRLFLHNHGWRHVRAIAVEPDAVTIRLQKDRTHLLLQCRRGHGGIGAEEVAALAGLRSAEGCACAYMATERAADTPLRAAALAKGIELVRFADIPFLGTFVA